jgi:nicotinamidase-related amidase
MMAGGKHNLHGSAPDKSPVALLLIDVINDMEFDGGAKLLKWAVPAARRIAKLKAEARRRGVPVIYVNDNFGRWRSDFKTLVRHCLEDRVRGEPVAKLLTPDEDDYFVLKPKHSGFYSTGLGILLDHLGASKLIVTGFATEICVLYTANDAYMRDYELIVPRDCVASETTAARNYALAQMKRYLRADVRPFETRHVFRGLKLVR